VTDIRDYYKPHLLMQRLQSDLEHFTVASGVVVEDASFVARIHEGVGDHLVLEAVLVGPTGLRRTVNGTSGEAEEDAYQDLVRKCVDLANEGKL